MGVLINFVVVQRAAIPISQTTAPGTALLILLASDRWVAWRYGEFPPRHARVLLLASQALLVEVAVWIEGFELSVFLYLLLPFTATLTFGKRAGLLTALLIWLVFALKVFAEDPFAVAVEALVLFALAAGFVLILSQLVLRERRARERAEQVLGALRQTHAELMDAHRQLAVATAATAELATLGERNRLAREIHDGLGHALTALAIQLEQAQSFRTRDAERAERAVATAKRLADEALTAVRRSVGVLRVPSASLQQALEALAAALGPGPPSVEVLVDADEQKLAPATRTALLRSAQEALTNVYRHASARHVWVQMIQTGEVVSLIVTDDGFGFDSAPGRQQGHGLAGIAERVALLGGRLEIVSTPLSGTTLKVMLPIGLRILDRAGTPSECCYCSFPSGCCPCGRRRKRRGLIASFQSRRPTRRPVAFAGFLANRLLARGAYIALRSRRRTANHRAGHQGLRLRDGPPIPRRRVSKSGRPQIPWCRYNQVRGKARECAV